MGAFVSALRFIARGRFKVRVEWNRLFTALSLRPVGILVNGPEKGDP